ncbi:MAG: IS30 family transposase [Cocleimonas sp.]|jgi:IS30 family transposase
MSKQLTQEQRYQLWRLNKMSYLQKEVAEIMGVSASTISRELQKNCNQFGRYTKNAHQISLGRRRLKSKPRINQEQWQLVEAYIRQDFSPEQAFLRLEYEGRLKVSHEWIYQYITLDKLRDRNPHTHLRCKKKNRKRYGGIRNNRSLCDRVGIEERPDVVNQRYGDWEVDIVIGRQGGKVLVTLVERKSKLSLIGLAENKTAQAVKETLLKLLSSISTYVHTLTYDNGPEFAQHKVIDKRLNSQGYFARSYCSGDRGLSENTNGLIRQYLPKRSSFDNVCQSYIENIMKRLNNRPRKTLKARTPNEVFFDATKIAFAI